MVTTRLVLLGVLFAVALPVQAAHVYLDIASTTYGRLDTFYVPVRIKTDGECINAARVAVAYDPAELLLQDVATGQSIFTLWTAFPEIETDADGKQTGRITFEGGIPGGYCGRVEGDPGLTNTLVQLVFTGVPKPVEMGDASVTRIILDPMTRVYLHDGTGEEVEPTLQGAEILLEQQGSLPNNPWLADVRADTIAPELFEIILVEGPSEGNNAHYIAFSTTDKQSGIDHYEVLETDPDRFGLLTWAPRKSYWVEAESPYVLRDQRLHSKIMVKAVDKNGNERVAVYTPPMSPFVELTRLSTLVPIFVLVLIGILIAGAVYRVRRRAASRAVSPEHRSVERTAADEATHPDL